MEKGYGFGGEGDWKTAAMVRLMKIMTTGKKDAKGTSFMEDYTYNLVPGKEGILEAHMLEVCPTIADGPISIKVNPEKEMPKLPVATAFWTPQPDLATGAEAWILAGGAHHTAFSYDITAEQMGDWAEAMGIEAVYIDKDTQIRNFKNELKWNSMYYKLNK